ncbi:CRISPR-associated endonuclease Cas3'' [Nitratidesulfovibrio sp. D1]|uniref:CRISPR-associated endonuclease Cas3'' n=1 Tax=Nitratidesulfovibrio sp. D1 TaxID=3440151 RepID=UPI003EBC9650
MPHVSSLRFWGKTNDRGGWHPLPYHCLDVAAVVHALLRADHRLSALVDRLSPLPPDVTRKLLLFFAAVHDAGKFAATFQHKVPELATANGVPRGRGRDDHTWLGFRFWSDWAYEAHDVVPFDERALSALTPLAICAFAHHGEPVERVLDGTVRPAFGAGWDVAVEHVTSCAALFLDGVTLPELEQTSLAPLSWLAAGLFIVADWLGSNERWFPHAVPGPQGPPPQGAGADLCAWFEQACTRADSAIAECGLLPPAPLDAPAFSALFPALAAHAPHPMQQEALRTSLGEGPQLFIIEDLTGGGKTEAALLLAARLLAAGRGGGVFVGLPTQATANAMYGRLAECVGRLFPDAAASLLLAHGGRALHDDFLASITTGGHAHRRDDTDGRAVCTPWLADSRKKALLAPCGVGTVDQALLGVLPSRHQALRLLGLARSVFIADEVHAYDEYT